MWTLWQQYLVLTGIYHKEYGKLAAVEKIAITTSLDGIYVYKIGKIVFVYMINTKRPKWDACFIAYGLPRLSHDFVVVDYNNHPFSFADDYIYSDGESKDGNYHSFEVCYLCD